MDFTARLRLHFTDHALDQMQKRGFSRADVAAIVGAPEVTYFGVDGKYNVCGTSASGRARVVLVLQSDLAIVITVIRLSKEIINENQT